MTPVANKLIEKDLSALRKEHQQLSTSINRLDMFRLVFVFLFAVALSSAFQKIHFADNAKIDKARSDFMRTLDQIADPKVVNHPKFNPTPFLAGYCPNPATYAKSLFPSWGNYQESRLGSSVEDLSSQVGNLCSLYQQEFAFQLDVLGGKMELDLRHWVFSLPFLYWCAEIYLQLLRKKLQVLNLLGRNLVETSPPEKILILDRLLFSGNPGKESLYARLPWDFLKPFYVLGTIAIFVYVAVIWKPFWSELDSAILVPLGHWILIFGSFHVAYSLRVSSRIQSELLAQFPNLQTASPSSALRKRFHRFVLWWQNRRFWARSLRFSRSYLVLGSALSLVTLFIATTADGCNSYKGYQLALGKADWIDSAFAEGFSKQLSNTAGRSAYLGALTLAVFTILLLIFSLRHPAWLRSHRLLGVLFVVSLALSSFVLTQIAFFVVVPVDLIGLLPLVWVPFWIGQLAAWRRFVFPRQAGVEPSWPGRHMLIFLYVPQIAALIWCPLLIFTFGDEPILGLGCYFVGIHLLTIGYLQLIYLSHTVRDPGELGLAGGVGIKLPGQS